MSNTKHTPGPWTYNGEIITDTNGNILHDNNIRTQEEETANAKLIAAAPDLFYAVKMAHDILRELPDDYDYEPGESPMEILKAAIKKATE